MSGQFGVEVTHRSLFSKVKPLGECNRCIGIFVVGSTACILDIFGRKCGVYFGYLWEEVRRVFWIFVGGSTACILDICGRKYGVYFGRLSSSTC
jgi:hypothetical protein